MTSASSSRLAVLDHDSTTAESPVLHRRAIDRRHPLDRSGRAAGLPAQADALPDVREPGSPAIDPVGG